MTLLSVHLACKHLHEQCMGYVLRLYSNASVSKLLLELLLLHVLLPAFLQHGLYCQSLRWLVSAWTLTATHMLYAGHTHSDTRGGGKESIQLLLHI